MRQTARLAAIAFFALAVPHSSAIAQRLTGAHPSGAIPFPVSLDTGTLFRAAYARVGDDLFVSGQPTEQALRDLKAQGVTTIVNLRSPEEMRTSVPFDEASVAAKLGMKYVYLPVRGTPDLPYSPATVAAFDRALKEADGKVLLHCTVAWRASHLYGAYLVQDRGLPIPTAMDHARKINLMQGMRMTDGRVPMEDFLNTDIPALHKAP